MNRWIEVGQAPGEPLIVHYSRAKLAAWIIIFGTVLASMLFLLLSELPSLQGLREFGGIIFTLAIAVMIAMCAILLVVMLMKMFDRRVQLRIDKKGLFVRAHSSKVIGLRSLRGMAWDGGRMMFSLYAPAKHPIESRHRRFLRKINGSEGHAFFGDVWIWTNQLACSRKDVLNAIHDFRPVTEYEQEMRDMDWRAKTDLVPTRL